ncbi:uncharacterized protein BCR38DRAFT_349277 [Pseudomassariella vexata]|uniref:S-adenosyl-L-methionine-dependent methyltransferase n=1 Tax=Pseudomassariella vexata TaxID=1141098 RepID=A0A1Y2DPI6_9PEZI|nr:uncharacterized protein BCR38DRAFT_349277 [Pseudomassariella vexata]ORY60585.1 hypothetical protein BCR38DRAFT_349277 [Pseudomassariella vexata]
MSPIKSSKPFIRPCEGSNWDSAAYVSDTKLHARVAAHLAENDLASAIATAFSLPTRDSYTYHANMSVSLAQVQYVISLGNANGLHVWYYSPKPPSANEKPESDIETYISIFAPQTLTPNILKTFSSNARKGSLRQSIASYLITKRYLHPFLPALQIPRSKKSAPPNPYLDFISWACVNLEWAGPCPASEALKGSHHVLPVFMHHFGCVCPSHEALSILKVLAAGREIWDMGSGNGYWAFMLRAYGLVVKPVDNAQSSWRVSWVSDTEIADGEAYIRSHDSGRDAVLLLVYPIVGGGIAGGQEGGFTRGLLREYKGDTVAVVGTQNHNGYTGFKNMSIDEYMEREQPGWTKVVQVPLPSFPGKDEALFVFQSGERAPPKTIGQGQDS